ncbi:MAG: hypothetical protein IKX20_07090 [Paludibacteraceae bacterium]|nr:hypothetical protein [Paludibacteraceae bacterium]
MGICKICQRHLGFLNRDYTCCFCNATICHDCATKFHFDPEVDAELFAFLYSIQNYWLYNDYELKEKSHIGWSSRYAYACPSCYRSFKSTVQTMIRNAKTIGIDNVRLYSYRYQGRIPNHSEEIHIKTLYFKDRNEAEQMMKAFAAHLGCHNVINVRFNKDTDSEGNYKFSVYNYEGIGIK